MQLVVVGHDTLLRLGSVSPLGLGVATIDQVVPFQRSANVFPVEPTKESPTALQLVGLGHETPFSPLNVAPLGLGLATIDQAVPFQRSVNVLLVKPAEDEPTAKQLVGLGHDTAKSALCVAPLGFGLATIDQVAPSQCSANALLVVLVS